MTPDRTTYIRFVMKSVERKALATFESGIYRTKFILMKDLSSYSNFKPVTDFTFSTGTPCLSAASTYLPLVLLYSGTISWM
jgi:hypothetical protein